MELKDVFFFDGQRQLHSAEKIDDSSWRRFGQIRRMELLKADREDDAGSPPVMNKNCDIERYYSVGDKVLTSFYNAINREDLDESFILGSRLVTYFSSLIPTHVQYYEKCPDITRLREKNMTSLEKVRKSLEEIIFKMDVEEMENAIKRSPYERILDKRFNLLHPIELKRNNQDIDQIDDDQITFFEEDGKSWTITTLYNEDEANCKPELGIEDEAFDDFHLSNNLFLSGLKHSSSYKLGYTNLQVVNKYAQPTNLKEDDVPLTQFPSLEKKSKNDHDFFFSIKSPISYDMSEDHFIFTRTDVDEISSLSSNSEKESTSINSLSDVFLAEANGFMYKKLLQNEGKTIQLSFEGEREKNDCFQNNLAPQSQHALRDIDAFKLTSDKNDIINDDAHLFQLSMHEFNAFSESDNVIADTLKQEKRSPFINKRNLTNPKLIKKQQKNDRREKNCTNRDIQPNHFYQAEHNLQTKKQLKRNETDLQLQSRNVTGIKYQNFYVLRDGVSSVATSPTVDIESDILGEENVMRGCQPEKKQKNRFKCIFCKFNFPKNKKLEKENISALANFDGLKKIQNKNTKGVSSYTFLPVNDIAHKN